MTTVASSAVSSDTPCKSSRAMLAASVPPSPPGSPDNAPDRTEARKMANGALVSRQADFDQKYAAVIPQARPTAKPVAVEHPGSAPVFKRERKDATWQQVYDYRLKTLQKEKPNESSEKLRVGAEASADMDLNDDRRIHRMKVRNHKVKLAKYDAAKSGKETEWSKAEVYRIPDNPPATQPTAAPLFGASTANSAVPATSVSSSGGFSLDGMPGSQTIAGWMEHFGIISTTVKDGDPKTRDTNISAVKSAIDNITSDSEMQMLRFRQMVDKRGTALQEAKTTLSNDKRLKDAIIQG